MNILKVIICLACIASLSGCRTIGLQSVINPIYEAKTKKLAAKDPLPTKEEIEKELEGIPKWLDMSKIDLRGTGKVKVDFTKGKEKGQSDSGIKIPFGDTTLRDIPMPGY